jgi:hypothetical protein
MQQHTQYNREWKLIDWLSFGLFNPSSRYKKLRKYNSKILSNEKLTVSVLE